MGILRNTAVTLLAKANQKTNAKQNFLFVLGHMRSGSSLLSHFLQSCPNVCGYGESNATYLNKLDLHKLAVRAKWRNAENASSPAYYLDQINHNEKTPEQNLFEDLRLQVIIILRKPNPSISSIIKLSEEYYSEAWTEERATSYYCERLNFLKSFYERKKPILLTYEELIAKTESTLKNLEIELGLKFPSYSSYQTHKHTGVHGDPSHKISQGKIIKTESPLLPLKTQNIHKAQKSYHDFFDSIA